MAAKEAFTQSTGAQVNGESAAGAVVPGANVGSLSGLYNST